MTFLNATRIINDTEMSIDCYVHCGFKSPRYIVLNGGETYIIPKTISQIEIQKEDIWNIKRSLNIFFLLLYSLDLIFGNMMDSVNLPFSVNYSLPPYSQQEHEYTIYLSKVLSTEEKNISMWKIVSTAQSIFICFIIAIIGIAFSFVFPNLYQVTFVSIVGISIICLYKKLIYNRNVLAHYLMKFSNKTGDGLRKTGDGSLS